MEKNNENYTSIFGNGRAEPICRIMNYDPCGYHLIATIRNLAYSMLNDLAVWENVLLSSCIESNLNVIGLLSKQFTPHGVTIIIMLAESHISVHTYPESNVAFLDAFTCGNKSNPTLLINHITKYFPLAEIDSQVIYRA